MEEAATNGTTKVKRGPDKKPRKRKGQPDLANPAGSVFLAIRNLSPEESARVLIAAGVLAGVRLVVDEQPQA